MKKIFLTGTFVCLVALGARDVQAQVYDSYYYDPCWDGAHINSIHRNMIRTPSCTSSTTSCIYLNTKLIQDIDSAVA